MLKWGVFPTCRLFCRHVKFGGTEEKRYICRMNLIRTHLKYNNMKKLITLMAAMLLTCSVQAQQVTLENARTEAASFFTSHGMSIAGGVKLSARAARRAQSTTTGTSTDAAYYIFNGAGDKGFVVISGDDRTEPVLGYSTTDTYDAASIPPNMQAFLDGYAAQIAQMDASSAAAMRRVKKHAAIEPLLQTKWNQTSPYNDLCPMDGDARSITGCEATSVAQIMAYHQYPKASTAIPAYFTETNKIAVPALPPVTFNWAAMPESGDKDQAVATLMRYVGQGENMDYTSQVSNSNDGPAIHALKTYFGYDPNIKYYNRPSYTISEWDSIIYASLTEKNPVLYGGCTTSGGHSFVCDGYDGNGLFHINWGWGGYLNNYFRLAVLNPHGTGSGGSAANSAYNMYVSAMTGIQPPTGKAAEPEFIDCIGIKANHTQLSAAYCNYLMDNQDTSYQCGWGRYDSDGKISAVITENPIKLEYGEETLFTSDLTEANLTKGTYEFFPIIRIPGVTDWKRAFASNVYVQVDVDAAGQIKTTSFPALNLTMDSIQFLTPKTLPYVAHVFAHVTNKGEELNSTLYLFASQTDDWGKTVNYTGAYIEANSKDSLEFYFTPQKAGTYHLALATDTLCTNIIGTQDVTIGENTLPKYTMEMVSFKQLTDTTINVVIRNTSTMDYKKHVTQELDQVVDDDNYIFLKHAYEQKVILAGQTQSFTLTIPQLESGTKYIYVIYYDLYSDSLLFNQDKIRYTFSDATGISSTPASVSATATQPYFSLDGMKMLKKPTRKGVYIHNGKKFIQSDVLK